MKKIFFLLIVLTTAAVSSCKNKSVDGCVQVKLINQLCGNAILQVVGGDVPKGIANSWTDNQGNTYKNVFSTFLDPCDTYPANGDTFYIRVIDERKVSNCAVCLALLADAPEEYLHTTISSECEVRGSDF